MRAFSLIVLAVVCVGVAMRAPATATAIPPGSYTQTCESIAVVRDNLNAKCQDISGNWHLTQANIPGCPSRSFANVDGGLVCGRGGYGISTQLPLGSWRATCQNASKSGGILYAQCDTGSGAWRSASLDLAACPGRVIDNESGYLVCRRPASEFRPNWLPNQPQQNWQNHRSYTMPGGSWSQSCRSAYIQGSMLYAQCDNDAGTYQQAQFDLNRAPGAALENVNGVLVMSNP
jgi:hypothetical protein